MHFKVDIRALCALLSGLALLAAKPTILHAVPLQIVGTYSGSFNGEPISAAATGMIDTDGTSTNSFNLVFATRPANLNPVVAGNSWNSSYHASATEPRDGAQNLFAVSGGDYIASRTVRWTSTAGYTPLPDEVLQFDAVVQTDLGTGIMSAVQTVNGTYRGPTDLLGIGSYTLHWEQLADNTIVITSFSEILRQSGDPFGAEIVSTYSGPSVSTLTHRLQHGRYFYSNQSFVDETLSFEWHGFVASVPLPATGLLLSAALGLSLIGARKLMS